MESAVAVHRKGCEFALWVRMKRSIFLTRSAVVSKEPRRLVRWVMRAKNRSTWLSQEANTRWV